MTWGQVRFMIFTLQAYGKILKCALLRVNESKPLNLFWIMTDYLICDDPGVTYWQGHRERSSEVMEVISSLLPINHDTMVLRLVRGTKLLVWSRRVVWHATWLWPLPPIRSWPDLDLRSSLNWPIKVIMYMFRIVSTRETQWRYSRVSIFLSSKVI